MYERVSKSFGFMSGCTISFYSVLVSLLFVLLDIWMFLSSVVLIE